MASGGKEDRAGPGEGSAAMGGLARRCGNLLSASELHRGGRCRAMVVQPRSKSVVIVIIDLCISTGYYVIVECDQFRSATQSRHWHCGVRETPMSGDRELTAGFLGSAAAPIGQEEVMESRHRPRGGTCFLEPHHDDHALASHRARQAFPCPHVLVTVFPVSQHANNPVGQGADINEVRRREGRAYCARFGRHSTDLGFADYPLREQSDASCDLFVEQVQDRLRQLLLQHRFDWVILPAPIGTSQHPDHVVLFRAAVGAVAGLARPSVAFVDDLPWSRRPLASRLRVGGQLFYPWLVPLNKHDLAEKCDALEGYASQVIASYFRAVARPAPGDVYRRASETVWLPLVPPVGERTTADRDYQQKHSALRGAVRHLSRVRNRRGNGGRGFRFNLCNTRDGIRSRAATQPGCVVGDAGTDGRRA